MNDFDKVLEGIQRVLDTRSSYQVAKDLGVQNRTINRYQNGTTPLENMTLGTAEKIYKYYLEEKDNMAKPYTVFAVKEEEYETIHGTLEFEVVKQKEIDCGTRTRAENEARKLYETGEYTSIIISVANKQGASTWLNPAVGVDAEAENWIPHFENEK